LNEQNNLGSESEFLLSFSVSVTYVKTCLLRPSGLSRFNNESI